jgi:hypothetical protein
MTRIITLDPEAALLSDGALALIKAIKTFEKDVLPKVSAEMKERQGLGGIPLQVKLCRETLESLRERLVLSAAGDEVPIRRR